MLVSKEFGSRFLKAADIVNSVGLDTDIPIKLMEVVRDKVYSQWERKEVPVWILTFSGTDKVLILKATNARKLASICGDDTDHWRGQRVNMRAELVQTPRGMAPGIRFHEITETSTSQQQEDEDEIDVPDVPPDADLHPLMDEGEEEDVDVEDVTADDVTADDGDEENDRMVDSYSPSHFAVR